MGTLKNLKKGVIFTFGKKIFKADFWRNRLNLVYLLSSGFFNLIIWLLLGYYIQPSEYPIPLHYNIYFGIDLTGSYRSVFNLPIIGLLIILINAFLSIWLYSKDRLISYILLLTALVVQIFVLIGAATVIYINR